MPCRSTRVTPIKRNDDPALRPRPGLAALLLAGLLTGCGAGEERIFEEIPSPGGDYVLRVTVAESRMPHGPFHVGAYLLGAGESTGPRIIDVTLENDGVPFTKRNVAVRWTGAGAALMCLRATDLPDRGFRIDVGEPPAVVEVEQC